MKLWRCLSLLAAGLAPLSAYSADDAGAEGPVSALVAQADQGVDEPATAGAVVVVQTKEGADDKGETIQVEIISSEDGGNAYWIGLSCATLEEEQRKTLNLEEPLGLLIESVADESPAKAAGFQAGDVIIHAKVNDADHKVTGVAQLAELVQAAGGKPLSLTILRDGNKSSIAVTPAKRQGLVLIAGKREGEKPREMPKGRSGRGGPPWGGQGGPPPWAGQGGPGRGPGGFSFRTAGPIIVKLREELSKFPDDMKITITKSGNQPAEIAISQGDKSWKVTDAELEKLPIDVRTNLAKFLGMGLMSKMRGSAHDMLKHIGVPMNHDAPPWARHGHAGDGKHDHGQAGQHRHGRGEGRKHDDDDDDDDDDDKHHGRKGRGEKEGHGHRHPGGAAGHHRHSGTGQAACSHCGGHKAASRHHGRGHWKHAPNLKRFGHRRPGGGPRHFGMGMRGPGSVFGKPMGGCPHCRRAGQFGGAKFGHFGRPGHGGPMGGPAAMPGAPFHRGPGAFPGGPLNRGPGMMRGPGSSFGPPQRPGAGGPPAAGGAPTADARMEAILSRLERMLSQQRPEMGRPGGGGGFGPPPGSAPQMNWTVLRNPQGAANPPGAPVNPDPRAERQEQELRAQLRQMQEQQEKMARAIRDLSEALERINKK